MKYLYPYECEKLKLSNPAELQAAIDGNRREGRRSSFGYDLSPGPTLLPTTHPHLNASLINGKLSSQESGEVFLSLFKKTRKEREKKTSPKILPSPPQNLVLVVSSFLTK